MEVSKTYKYGIKSTFAQCFAVSGVNLLQIEIGAETMTSTVVIGSLTKNMTNNYNWTNDNEGLSMTSEQASWFGSILYLCTPLGSVLSSLLVNRIGHKKCLILTNVPYLVSQIMMFYAKDVEALYVSSILMGLSVGFATGPCYAYTGEVCEPKLRGALASAINVFYNVGSFIFTVIYSVTKRWRLTILISTVIPIINIVILFVIPDSPMWLLTKGKTGKAQKTLRKLRGKISYEKCESEFQEMIEYTSTVTKTPNDQNHDVDTSVLKLIICPEVLRPFRLLMVYFVFAKLLNGIQYSPYLMEVFTEFGAPVSVDWTISFVSGISMVGSVMTVLFVNKLGKRFLSLSTMFICSVCYILIGLIGVYWTNSNSKPITSWIVLILYLTTSLMSSVGIFSIAWTLVGEIFPMKGRNITCNISTALAYIISFMLTKYYPSFASLVDFYNTFTIFGIGGLFCTVYLYFYLPETENKTLQEISASFK